MQEITISLSENTLKISTVEKGEFKGVSAEIAPDVVEDHRVLNIDMFTQAVKDLVGQITDKNPRSLLVNFLVEPQDVILKFFTVNKGGGSVEEQITNEFVEKVPDQNLEDLYYSHLKIAPFVYQFIGIRKELLDQQIEIANRLEMGLRSSVPWVTFLPKFVNINEPAIFLSKLTGKQFVALSEFNSIFFYAVYEKDKSTEELQQIVEELSVYKRKDPISKVYIYNHESFSLNPEYTVLEMEMPNSEMEEAKGYEMHLLVDFMIKKDKSLLVSQYNLLNLLPVPVVVEKNTKALVPVAIFTALFLVGIIFGGATLLKRTDVREVLQSRTGQDETVQEEAPQPESQIQEEVQVEEEVLNKEDLIVRIENGAGIPGIAGRTQEFIEEFGYQVESIGNADEVGRLDTLLKFKAEKAKYQELLSQDMSENFSVVVEEDLDETLPYDVLMIIGTDAQL